MIDIHKRKRLTLIAKTTQATMKGVLRFCGTTIELNNLENAKGDSILFVANHFTRFETFLLPYLLLRETGQLVNNIAAMGIFGSKFWNKYLAQLGVHPLKFSKRDEVIINDLSLGRSNWLIYPESAMIRNKKVRNSKGELCLDTPFHKGFPRTGAASLALRALAKRRELLRVESRKSLSPKLVKHLVEQKIRIVPITISYYPIRPSRTWLKPFMGSFVGRSSPIAHEEGMVEGQLILSSQMLFDFHKPIDVEAYANSHAGASSAAAKTSKREKSKPKQNLDAVHQSMRYSLTDDFMRRIYNQIPINMDHLFLAVVRSLRAEVVGLDDLKIWVSVLFYEAMRQGRFLPHPSLEGEVGAILSGREGSSFSDVLRQSIAEGLVERTKGDELRLRRSKLDEPCDFFRIRLRNICQVICNEMLGIEGFWEVAKKVARKRSTPQSALSEVVSLYDRELYGADYEAACGSGSARPAPKSPPAFLRGSRELGVVLSHGYGASPSEVRGLADYLHRSKGWSVYVVRLKGHGTLPNELASVKWREWYDSYRRGFYALSNHCSSLVFGGVSTGGLMAVVALGSLPNPKNIKGIFTINTPIVLRNKKHHLVSAMHLSNVVMKRFNMNTFNYDSVQNNTEFPETNYNVYYVKSLMQLKEAIEAAKKKLHNIHKPLLVIQSKGDPVVDASSARLILERSRSVEKSYYEIPSSQHTVVRKEGKEQVFGQIGTFIANL